MLGYCLSTNSGGLKTSINKHVSIRPFVIIVTWFPSRACSAGPSQPRSDIQLTLDAEQQPSEAAMKKMPSIYTSLFAYEGFHSRCAHAMLIICLSRAVFTVGTYVYGLSELWGGVQRTLTELRHICILMS